MNVAAMNTRVMIQKCEPRTDKYGNHKPFWSDYYSCFATICGEDGKEQAVVGETVENTDLNVTVRYCKKLAEVTPTGYRVRYQNEIYNILVVDHLNLKKKALKFRCRRERR